MIAFRELNVVSIFNVKYIFKEIIELVKTFSQFTKNILSFATKYTFGKFIDS